MLSLRPLDTGTPVTVCYSGLCCSGLCCGGLCYSGLGSSLCFGSLGLCYENFKFIETCECLDTHDAEIVNLTILDSTHCVCRATDLCNNAAWAELNRYLLQVLLTASKVFQSIFHFDLELFMIDLVVVDIEEKLHGVFHYLRLCCCCCHGFQIFVHPHHHFKKFVFHLRVLRHPFPQNTNCFRGSFTQSALHRGVELIYYSSQNLLLQLLKRDLLHEVVIF
mmetsp:Transcript_73175/g.139082  ORF Transcript_73175/g.139082 Transcript_73175/m.139082 type:complete len:221 (+) Transcript_73175:212-874(+)